MLVWRFWCDFHNNVFKIKQTIYMASGSDPSSKKILGASIIFYLATYLTVIQRDTSAADNCEPFYWVSHVFNILMTEKLTSSIYHFLSTCWFYKMQPNQHPPTSMLEWQQKVITILYGILKQVITLLVR